MDQPADESTAAAKGSDDRGTLIAEALIVVLLFVICGLSFVVIREIRARMDRLS